MLPRGGARQQKVRHVHAGDEQHKPNSAQQYKKNRAHVANHFILQRKQVGFFI